jgi:hypothetical protein
MFTRSRYSLIKSSLILSSRLHIMEGNCSSVDTTGSSDDMPKCGPRVALEGIAYEKSVSLCLSESMDLSRLGAVKHFSQNCFTWTGGSCTLNISSKQFSSVYKTSGPTSQKTPCVSIANSNRFVLFRQIVAVLRNCNFVKLQQVVRVVTTVL